MTTRPAKRHESLKGTRRIDPVEVVERVVTSIEEEASTVMMLLDSLDLVEFVADADKSALADRLACALAKLERFRVEMTGSGATRNAIRCGSCGERFDAARADAAYCSPACRQAAYRRRKN